VISIFCLVPVDWIFGFLCCCDCGWKFGGFYIGGGGGGYWNDGAVVGVLKAMKHAFGDYWDVVWVLIWIVGK